MAGQRGRDVLLKLANEAGSFITVAGIRTKTLQLAAGTVDGTSADSPEAWRELVTGAGVKSARLSGAGVFKDAASDAQIRALFFAGDVGNWQLILPDFGRVEGPFQISELAYSGEHDGEAAFTAGVGRLLAPLTTGPLGRWDEGSELVVEMPNEMLASLTEPAVFAVSVPLLVQNAASWELVAYRDAELIGLGRYRLTGLLRGLRGSEIAGAGEGAVCILLDQRLQRAFVQGEEIGLDLHWQADGRGLFGLLTKSRFEDRAGLAFAPVHLRTTDRDDGGLDVRWIRRGVEITDNWVAPDAPNTGRFRAQVRRGAEVLLESETDAPAWSIDPVWQPGDIFSVRELGDDGRAGHVGRLVL